MLNEYAFISGDLLTDGILIFILVVFFEFTRRELFALSRSKKLLNRILEIKSIGKVNSLCLKSIDNSQLAWVTEHLVYIPKEKALEIESDGGKWLSKSSISQMLPTYDIARYRMIPAFLASIGITGTFVGITMGLKDFHLASDSVSLLSSAAGLLEGMKTAFYTSLAGLSTSALFMVVTKYASSSFSKSQAMLLTHLSRYYYEATPIYYLKRIAENTQQSAQISEVSTASAKSTEKKEAVKSPVETDVPASTPVIEDVPATQALPVVEKQIIDTDELANKFYEAVNYSIQSNISPKLETIVQQVLTSSQGREQSQKEMLDILVRKLRFEITQPLSSEIRQLQLIAQEGGKGENTLGESPEKSIMPSPPSVAEENYRMVYQPTGKKSQQKIEIEMDEVTP